MAAIQPQRPGSATMEFQGNSETYRNAADPMSQQYPAAKSRLGYQYLLSRSQPTANVHCPLAKFDRVSQDQHSPEQVKLLIEKRTTRSKETSYSQTSTEFIRLAPPIALLLRSRLIQICRP